MINWNYEQWSDQAKADYLYDTAGLIGFEEATVSFLEIWGLHEYVRILDSIEYENRHGSTSVARTG